jgi:hypothetical protein
MEVGIEGVLLLIITKGRDFVAKYIMILHTFPKLCIYMSTYRPLTYRGIAAHCSHQLATTWHSIREVFRSRASPTHEREL